MKTNFDNQAAKTVVFGKSKNFLSLILFTAIFALFSINGVLNVSAQDDRKIIKLADSKNPQMNFTEAKVAGQIRKFDERFDAEPEWLKNLSFTLENISGKPIVFLQIKLNFPETKATGKLISHKIVFGRLPDSKLRQRYEPIKIMPGETFEVSLEKEKDGILELINRQQPIELIQGVELEIGLIVFEDRTGWLSGNFMCQDPNKPEQYNRIGSGLPC